MPDQIEILLKFVYGNETAAQLRPAIDKLIQAHRQEAPSPSEKPSKGLPLDQTDSLLITYGDQVRNPDEPPLATLASFCQKHLSGLVGGVHILPFYPFTSDDGFSVVDFREVNPDLGTWQEVRQFHPGFKLMFDAVFNHVSVQSRWFQGFLDDDPQYRDYFIDVPPETDLSQVIRPRALPLLTPFKTRSGEKHVWTTFSADQVDVNARHPAMILELIEVLLFYVSQGAQFIRLDAIAFLWKEIGTTCLHLPETHALVQLMRAVLVEAAPQVMLITETNVPHEDNLSYFGDGTNEAQLVYNFALPPLTLHALLTGDGSHLTRWAQGLKLPSREVTFFNFLASHDGIGVNPARGILSEEEIESVLVAHTLAHGGFISKKSNPDGSKSPYELNISYFDALSDPGNQEEPDQVRIQRFLVSQAIMLSLAGMPGIYFHSLFGSRNDRQGAESSGMPRRINRAKCDLKALESELSDPDSIRARVFQGYARLLTARKQCPAFHPAGPQKVHDLDSSVFALTRQSPDGSHTALCLHNLSAEPVALSGKLEDLEGTFTDMLNDAVNLEIKNNTLEATLQPYQVSWLVKA